MAGELKYPAPLPMLRVEARTPSEMRNQMNFISRSDLRKAPAALATVLAPIAIVFVTVKFWYISVPLVILLVAGIVLKVKSNKAKVAKFEADPIRVAMIATALNKASTDWNLPFCPTKTCTVKSRKACCS